MARRFGRHRSIILGKLRQNRCVIAELRDLNGYRRLIARGNADRRRSRGRKLLRERVEHGLSCGWTPEQIAG